MSTAQPLHSFYILPKLNACKLQKSAHQYTLKKLFNSMAGRANGYSRFFVYDSADKRLSDSHGFRQWRLSQRRVFKYDYCINCRSAFIFE